MKTTDRADEKKTEVGTGRRDEIPSEQEMAAFRKAVAKWRGSATERMRRLGFNSTDEFIDAIRGRNAE